MIGQLETNEIEKVLSQQLLGRIGCRLGDVIYIVPVSYVYDGRYVYVRSKDGMKVDMMRKNPEICFEVESFQDLGNWKTVIAWGSFEELSDEEERKAALQKLYRRHLPIVSSETTHLSPHWPFEPADLNSIEGVVFRVELTKKTGRFEKLEAVPGVANSLLG
jgi:nitroimidazol reductase NimA-like FMN-containing flavoprotein (pyridoxamine 5'-phosphate oxidase superfamily)